MLHCSAALFYFRILKPGFGLDYPICGQTEQYANKHVGLPRVLYVIQSKLMKALHYNI